MPVKLFLTKPVEVINISLQLFEREGNQKSSMIPLKRRWQKFNLFFAKKLMSQGLRCPEMSKNSIFCQRLQHGRQECVRKMCKNTLIFNMHSERQKEFKNSRTFENLLMVRERGQFQPPANNSQRLVMTTLINFIINFLLNTKNQMEYVSLRYVNMYYLLL